ncbi:hypothetical protein PybrP1_011883 [[Pythium] brassicae (nom. inval.)]|nr:hypothetical protein PybrP1_011883 [[Pythium] brassicae (nom. inval.)]
MAPTTTHGSTLDDKDAPHWDDSEIPSQLGKVAIVTGANSGIGFETAKKLAEHGATVVLACRNEERGRSAERDILTYLATKGLPSSSHPQVVFMRLDVGKFASVHTFSDAFHERFVQLDLLVNNAGIGLPAQKFIEDGIESQFGINHLGHFLLTKLLFDLLKKSPAARVVSISSNMHRHVKAAFDSQGRLVPESGYPLSKLANLLFAYELERRLRVNGIRNVMSVAAHPGFSETSAFKTLIETRVPRVLHWLAYLIVKLLPFQSAEMGALPPLYAATAESVQGMEYFGPHRRRQSGYPIREISSPESYDEEKARKLWAYSEMLVKCTFDAM